MTPGALAARVILGVLSMQLPGGGANSPTALVTRRYVEGAVHRYQMTAQDGDVAYTVRVTATTKDVGGRFVDELSWSELVVNGTARVLTAVAQLFRLEVTLEGGAPFAVPDLAKAPGLVGPVTDTMTFYADLFLAMHQGTLRRPGDRIMFRDAPTASWADGRLVILGEDHVDFEITLAEVDTGSDSALLQVKHVPPAAPKVRLPADWMRPPVADTANNWVMVRQNAGGYVASVGKETFDVSLRVGLSDGVIQSARLTNPVVRVIRDCTDVALTECSAPRPDRIMRQVQLSPLP